MDVIALANRIPTMIFGSKSDDDLSDRVNYRYTVALLLLFAVIITTRQFGSETIKCWVPAHFTSNYEQYASQICWISNTYRTNKTENIPKTDKERQSNEIKYYQWVSFLLLFQAFLFYMPRIIWRSASIRSGLDICDLVEAANSYKAADKFNNRGNYMEYLVTNIEQYVDDDRRYDETRFQYRWSKMRNCLNCIIPCAGTYLGNYIVILYLTMKVIYTINIVIQAWILSKILGKDFYLFGTEFISKIFKGESWVFESEYFPKVAYCDFYIREWGNPNKSHRYTIQCVLPINLFNQQIFIFIWIWFNLIFTYNFIDFFKWSIRCLPFKSNKWMTRRIKLFNSGGERPLLDESPKLIHFLEYYLEPDGMFLIRMIGNNSSDFVATDLIKELWKKHYLKYDFSFEPQSLDTGIEQHTQDDNDNKHKRNCRISNIPNKGETKSKLEKLKKKHKDALDAWYEEHKSEIQQSEEQKQLTKHHIEEINDEIKYNNRSSSITETVNENNNTMTKRTHSSTKV